MTILRANLEHDIVEATREFLAIIGKSLVDDGTNVELNGSIAYALRQSGLLVADRALITDIDLSLATDDLYDQISDLAIFRTLLNIQGSMTLVDTHAGPFTDKYSQAYKPLKDLIDYYMRRIGDLYGLGVGEAVGGVITVDIASHRDRRDMWNSYGY